MIFGTAACRTVPTVNRYMMKFLFARMSEPQAPSWNNETTDWKQSKPIGNAAHQKMFQHVWDWHCGKA